MKYLYIFLTSLKAKMVYRTDLVLEYVLTALQVCCSILVWRALYQQKSLMVANYSLQHLGIYLFLANFLALSFNVAPAFRLALQIKSGQLSTILERPISLYGEHLAHFLGNKFLGLILDICLVLYLGLVTDCTFLHMVFLLVYLSVAWLMFFSLMMILGMLAFWLIELWPLRSFVTAFYLVFGGRYFPLEQLPSQIFKIVVYNPFSLVTDIPARFLTIGMSNLELFKYLMATTIWLVIFLYLYKIVLKKGLRRYEGIESI